MKRFTFLSTLLGIPSTLWARRLPDDTFCCNGHQGEPLGYAAVSLSPTDKSQAAIFDQWLLYSCKQCSLFYTVYTPTLKRRNQPNAR